MKKKNGFTLIELMVVIAVIGILAVVLVPNVTQAVNKGRVARTVQELQLIANAMDAYLLDVGSYPPSISDFGRAWGADVGLVDKNAVHPSHLSAWAGPYLKSWPQRTAWGGLVAAMGATGAYYIARVAAWGVLDWIDRDGIAGNDYYVHMNPYYARYPPQMALEIDKVMDDGVANTGNVRIIENVSVYSYVGEGVYSW